MGEGASGIFQSYIIDEPVHEPADRYQDFRNVSS